MCDPQSGPGQLLSGSAQPKNEGSEASSWVSRDRLEWVWLPLEPELGEEGGPEPGKGKGWLTKPSPIWPVEDNIVPFIHPTNSYRAAQECCLGTGEKEVNKTDRMSCFWSLPRLEADRP